MKSKNIGTWKNFIYSRSQSILSNAYYVCVKLSSNIKQINDFSQVCSLCTQNKSAHVGYCLSIWFAIHPLKIYSVRAQKPFFSFSAFSATKDFWNKFIWLSSPSSLSHIDALTWNSFVVAKRKKLEKYRCPLRLACWLFLSCTFGIEKHKHMFTLYNNSNGLHETCHSWYSLYFWKKKYRAFQSSSVLHFSLLIPYDKKTGEANKSRKRKGRIFRYTRTRSSSRYIDSEDILRYMLHINFWRRQNIFGISYM